MHGDNPPLRVVIIWRGLVLLADVVSTLLALWSAAVETPTVDEFAHVPAGLAHLEYGA